MSRRTVAARRRYNQMLLEEWDHHELAGRSKFDPPRDLWQYPVVHQSAGPWHRVAARARSAAIRADLDRYLRRMGAR